jgi:hypothetical protein
LLTQGEANALSALFGGKKRREQVLQGFGGKTCAVVRHEELYMSPIGGELCGEGDLRSARLGGILQQVLRSVDVECLPTDIVEKFDIDVSNLGVDQTMFVRDLQLGDKFSTVTRGELALAVVKAPADAPASAGGDNPEVIKKGKEEKK